MKRLEQILEEVNKAENKSEKKPIEGLQQIVFLLKNAFAEEMTAYYQYLILEYFATNLNEDKEFVKIFNSVISDFRENAKEELEDHAFWILGRLKELGADCSAIDNPSLIDNLAKHKYITPTETNNILTCIDQVAEAERGAIETYTELVEFSKGKDDITHKKMKEILKDEEKHLKEMEDFTKKISEYYNKKDNEVKNTESKK